MRKAKIKAVIFDWAGTVVDFGSMAPVEAFTKLFRKYGVSLSQEDARGPMGMNKRTHIEHILRNNDPSMGSTQNIDELYREFIGVQMNVLAQGCDLFPETLIAQEGLRSHGIKIGSTTGYNSDMIALVAEQARSKGFAPDCVVSASDVSVGRPSPWMAFEALRRLNVFPPEAVVKVGDTMADIGEGLNAGMITLGVVDTGNEVGLTRAEFERLNPAERKQLQFKAKERFFAAGAHGVLADVGELVPWCLQNGLL